MTSCGRGDLSRRSVSSCIQKADRPGVTAPGGSYIVLGETLYNASVATPIIQSVGSSSGTGAPGEGRNDLVEGEQVDLFDTEPANVGSVYFWEFEDAPIGTAPSMTGPTSPTPHFLVDADPTLAGSYRVKCTVNGLDSSFEILAKPLRATGARIPSFQERTGYNAGGNLKGWHEAETAFKRTVDERLHNPGPGQAGDQIVQLIWGGGRETHNSDTPLVVGGFALNPNDYSLANTTVAFQFVVIAANGTTPLTAHAMLYNLTDGEIVTSSVLDIINDTDPAKYAATLAVGVGSGKIKTSGEKVYECRIYLDAPPDDPTVDTIELFKAEVRCVFTVVTA